MPAAADGRTIGYDVLSPTLSTLLSGCIGRLGQTDAMLCFSSSIEKAAVVSSAFCGRRPDDVMFAGLRWRPPLHHPVPSPSCC